MHAPRTVATGRTASPSTARRINDRLALQLLQSEGPLTANQLKALTGLSRPTVADLVERLQEAGLIAVVGESGAARRGPNARLYGIVADRAHLVGLDLRPHRATVAVADLLGRTRAEHSIHIRPGTPAKRAVAATHKALDTALRTAGASGAHTFAVGAPGLVDPVTGRLGGTDRLSAWHADLIAALRAGPAPVLLENEVNLAAIAEQRDGAARDRDTFVLLWLSHGTGAAVVLDGRLRRGASGGAGEIGFLPVPGTAALPSAHGCDGGFHSLAGSAAIVRLAAEHGITADAAAQEGDTSPDDGAPPAEALVRAALADPEGGGAFLDALAGHIAIGAAAVSAVLDPGCVVLGGEIGRAGGTELADRVGARLARISPLATEVRAGTTGGSGVLRGAVLAAMDAAQEELFAGGG
ncbi:ROK family transcriptional regulator [Streptomyces sp. NPDC048644]|uniref:ROK family transcriptional regulator n=1 Tax=Streptomyces sp. NPDC048644 TaxID=3365582 RepID=UPI00371D0543